MSAVRVRVFGIPETVRSLNRGIRSQIDMHDTLELLGEEMTESIKANFESEGRRGGGSWALLKRDTMRRKHGAQILFEHGRLFNSVAVWRGPGQQVQISGHKITMSTDVPYAAVHQHGGGRNIPARPYVKFIDSDRMRWKQILHYNLIKAMNGV